MPDALPNLRIADMDYKENDQKTIIYMRNRALC